MSRRRFEVVPHTADKSIKAYGRDLKELFENAAYGMFSLMAELETHRPVEERRFQVEAEDNPELLRAWLAELLYTFEVDRMLFVEFSVEQVDEGHAAGTAKGVPFSQDIDWLGSILKAVTHHDLSVEKVGRQWEARVVFDV